MKSLLLGNEAVARGLYEAGVCLVSSYPGTPSTEITEYAAKYDEIYCEWAPNEKVAMEVAIGASIAGKRAFTAMKHVGLNVASDPLYTISYIGVNGGLVIAVADDPGMHSSQNEQDSRNYAKGSKVPMLEPSNSAECLLFTKLAFEMSEKYDTPVILRLSTRISHSRTLCDTSERIEAAARQYEKSIPKNVMMPAMAIKKHPIVEQRTAAIAEYAESSGLNRVEDNGSKIGVITSGSSYPYAKEALGNNVNYLKLGIAYPMPVNLLKNFTAKCETVFVMEELDDFIESHCRKLGIDVIGKEIFSFCGEYSQSIIKEAVLGIKPEAYEIDAVIPPRPPVMCAGCPHRGVFYALKRSKVFVSGDIGCYTLGAAAPLQAVDTVICMGASVSGAHGYAKAVGGEKGKSAVAVIGDSTFIHSGITGLIDITYNRGNSVTIIMDNSITGMTGHQHNPTTGYTIKGDPTAAVDLESLVKAVGINRVTVVDPYDIESTYQAIQADIKIDEPTVIITRRPCALLKSVKHKPPLRIAPEKCTKCKACMRIGCPAISIIGGEVKIDRIQCVGCGQCTSMCKFDAIQTREEQSDV